MSLNIKKEPEWEYSGQSFCVDHDNYVHGTKPDLNVEVKVEAVCSDDVPVCLHAAHVVKEEGLWPEKVQTCGKLRDCYVRIERISPSFGKNELNQSRSTAHQSRAARHTAATGERHTIDTYMCDYCSKIFMSKNYLITHIQSHINKTYAPTAVEQYICEICAKQYIQKSHLYRHYRSHAVGKPYACDVCNRKYTRLNNLKNHMSVHMKDKNSMNVKKKFYSCDICNKCFSRKITLKLHRRIHTGQKPYACKICKQRFTGNNNIKRHMRAHTGERPYSCDICDKKFSRLSNLNEHVEVHSGKMHRCTVCCKLYKRLRTLKLHEKNYHV